MRRGHARPVARTAAYLLLAFASLLSPSAAAAIESPEPTFEPDSKCRGTQTLQVSMKYKWDPPVTTGAEDQRPGFTPLLCVAHGPDYSLWALGRPASPGVTALLQTQNFTPVMAELEQNRTYAGAASWSRSGLNEVPSPGDDLVNVTVNASTANATLVSCIAGIVPSPDWFVGFSAADVCNGSRREFVSRRLQLRSYDAAFDDLESFRGQSVPVLPPGDVRARVGLGPSLGEAVVQGAESPMPPAALPPPGARAARRARPPDCFPASARAALPGGAPVAMPDLRVGARVQAAPGAPPSPVYALSHADPTAWAPFVRAAYADPARNATRVLAASPGHLVYALRGGAGGGGGAVRLVPMDALRRGDRLVGADGAPRRVVRVSRAVLQGLYNPHTLHGDIVVDGVRASCYTRSVPPSGAAGALAPLRALHAAGFAACVRWLSAAVFSDRARAALTRVLPTRL